MRILIEKFLLNQKMEETTLMSTVKANVYVKLQTLMRLVYVYSFKMRYN